MFKLLFKELRPRQWIKNIVVFAPALFDRQLTNPQAVIQIVAAFSLFCLISSVVYIFNDITDLEADRRHPQKRLRPLPSGALPVPYARTAAILLLFIAFPLSFWLSPAFAAIIAGYLVLNVAYSRWLKHIPILDVMVLATGFVLRVAGGVVVIHVQLFSPWLYVLTTLLALYLGFGKRRAELALLAGEANSHRPVLEGYTLALLDQLITIVSSSTLVVYCLYTFANPSIAGNHTMMLTIPFVMFGIFRYLYLVQNKHSGGAPEELLLSDRSLQATIVLWGLSILIILYLLPQP